jgi:1-acyl-sn-glycerol-3-phosphate acyltransferase
MANTQQAEERIANSEKRVANSGFLSRLRSYCIFVPLIYLYTGIMGSLSLLSSFFDRDGRMQHWFAVHWARMILKTVGVGVHIDGLEHIDPAQPAVYAANHLSALDIPVLYANLPVQFRILAKRELFSYPFLGWHLKRSGQIPIDQGDARASLRSLNHASASLRNGMPLVIFPEGGRSPSGQMRDFMGGAFYMAIKAQAPVVPIVLVGTYEQLPMNSFYLRPGQVDMIIGQPIPTIGMVPRQMDKLSAQVREVMLAMYESRAKGAGVIPNGGRAATGVEEPVSSATISGEHPQSR